RPRGLFFDANGANLDLIFSLKNTGPTPAVTVRIVGSPRFDVGSNDRLTALDKVWAPRCFEWAIGASRLSTGPYRNRSWRLPRGSPRIRFRWSKAGLADALPRAMRLKCKRNVPTAPEVRYLGDLAAQRALAAKGWAFGIASPNSDQRT